MRSTILVSPHVNSFLIEYDDSPEADVVVIAGVKVSVDLLRQIFVSPDPDRVFSLRRDGDTVFGQTHQCPVSE